jgi:hypothetical protein
MLPDQFKVDSEGKFAARPTAIDIDVGISQTDLLRTKIPAAYVDLTNARKMLYDAHESVIAAKTELEDRKAALILGGQITGKNESERAACTRSLTKPLLVQVEAAEREERVATLALELTLDARRNLEDMLKIEEIARL